MVTKVTNESGATVSTIEVGRGLVADFVLPGNPRRTKVAVLTQPGAQQVALAYVDRLQELGLETHSMVLPDREEAKTWEVVAKAHGWLAEIRLTRSDTVLGVGGGSLTDVAGFVAATWLRGVEVAHIPTTLLGAVDAAVGGKTGINLAGKNLVGAFCHPTSVTIDLDVLDAVPLNIQREGWAEVYKTALIADPDLLELLHDSGPLTPLDDVVERVVRFKAEVVSEDFREFGRRAVLNFGHTIGHAVEFASGCSHGEAVAVGIVAAVAISRDRYGFDTNVREGLAVFALPTTTNADAARVSELLLLDKKNDADGVRMVLLQGVGDPIVDHVTDDEIELALRSVGL
jgi:3-dehydroquinate synthase